MLDKSCGMSSNAALQKARWLFNAAKGGHTGTLDPLATGLLPLCLGEATKFSSELLDADKAYRATVRLGMTTDTADAEGTVLETRPVDVSESRLKEALSRFLGKIDQIPPMHSALKRDGKPLYEYARQGIELERSARQVTIHALDLRSFDGEFAVVDVVCSKGTYVRTLAADLGVLLGCGAHLSALRRTAIASLHVDDAITLTELEALAPEVRDTVLSAPDSLLLGVPVASLNEAETSRVLHGQGVRWYGEAGSRWRLADETGKFLGLGELSNDGWLNPKRLVAAPSPA